MRRTIETRSSLVMLALLVGCGGAALRPEQSGPSSSASQDAEPVAAPAEACDTAAGDAECLRTAWRSCQQGDTARCAGLARRWMTTRSLEIEGVELERVFQGGCAEQIAWSCRRLASALLDEGRVAEARQPAQQGCEGGDVEACGLAGAIVLSGRGSQTEEGEAVLMLDVACQGGVIVACENLGVAYRDGRGVAVDRARAYVLFERACAAGDSSACVDQGVALVRGEGIAADVSRGREVLASACEAGEEAACRDVTVVDEALAEQASEPAPRRYPLTIDSLSLGTGASAVAFEDVGTSCNMFGVIAGLGSLATPLRRCLRGRSAPRVRVVFDAGRTTEVEILEPAGRTGACVERALRATPVAALSCELEATIRTP